MISIQYQNLTYVLANTMQLKNVTEEKKNTGVRPVFSAKFQDSGVLQVLRYTMHAIFADFFARLAAGQLDSSILGSFEKI